MDQRWLRNFIPAAVGYAEDEKGEPLKASFARTAESGASFGRMQNDIRTNPEAAKTFTNILEQAGIDPNRIGKIVQAGTRRGVSGEQFEQEVPGATAQVNAALGQNPGMVRDQDASSTFWLRTKVANALGGANTNPNGPGQLGNNPAPTLVAKLGGWLNRTGDKEAHAVREFLHDTPEVTEAAFDGFLRGRPYFRDKRGETVEHWTGRLGRATAIGQEAYDNAPAPPEPANLFNTEGFRTEVAGRNLLNSDRLADNLFNTAEESFRKAWY